MTFEEYTFINEYNDNYNPVVAVKLADDERLINNNQALTDCILNAWKKYNILFKITENTSVKDIEYAIPLINTFEANEFDFDINGNCNNYMENIISVHKNNAYICNPKVKA